MTETKPITIRRPSPEDGPALLDAIQESLADVLPWMPELHGGLTLDEIESWITEAADSWQTGQAFHLLIIDPVDGHLVGGCGLTRVDTRHMFANLYYWVRSSCTGQGAATQAVELLASLAFDALQLQRVEILVAVDNPASQRVAEKAGAKQEGVLRRRLRLPETPTSSEMIALDALLYSLLPGDLALQES